MYAQVGAVYASYTQKLTKNINFVKQIKARANKNGKEVGMEKAKTTQRESMERIQEREDVATKFVLEKLKNAGIEVVTDKDEFNRILEAEKFLQKMIEAGENPEKIERQRQRVNGLVASQETMNLSDDNIANAFKQLDRSLRFNANFEIQSEGLGEEVSVFPGSTGKHGLGIRHIIEERTKKDNLTLDEITALSALIVDAVQTGDITRDSENRCEISKSGIIAIVRKDFDDKHQNWILTGFHCKGENIEKNREATETIQTVIAKYGQSPDYSYFRSQVGAVVASLDLSISQTPTKSSGVSKIASQSNETAVKDSSISVTSLKTETINRRASILCPSDTYRLLSHVKSEDQEHFGVILLDAAHNVKAVNTVSVGTINRSLVHPRDVFSEAVKAKAAAIIVFHNHPSGNPSPSDDDLNTTRALLKASEVVGIPILDHVIATESSYYSFLEHDILDDLRRGTEFLIKDNQTYGFTHNGKVYLNPEIMNANAAVHEYTHLWDKYMQNSNPELWERGKEILSKTHLWSEVKADPNYADISNDDDLILSEVHSRICGRIAEQVLERIAREDGEIARDKAIDWDRAASEYVAAEFLSKAELGKESYTDDHIKTEYLKAFLSMPMKDLMNEKHIALEKSQGENIEIKPEELDISEQERAEFKAVVERSPSEARQLQKAFEIALYKNPSPLVEVPLTRENYNTLYPQGYVETPIETVKLGEHQFEKLQRSDRSNLLLAGYETLTKPSIVFDLYSIDKTDGELKPVHVYGKSFYRTESGHKRVVESVIIFRDDESIAIGIYKKDANNFVKQIKTADDIIYCDENISRVASLILKDGGDHVRLYGINTEAINSRYNANEILSTQQFVDKEEIQKLVEPVKKENAMKLEEGATVSEEMTSILQEPKVEINGEMTESLPLLNENRWIDGREMPVWIIANAIDYINEKTECPASKIADIDSIPEEVRKDAISVALKNHIKDGEYSYLLDSKNNLRQEAFDREVKRLDSNFKDTAKLMFETLDEENTMQNSKEEKTMEATEKQDGKANGGVKNLDVMDVIYLLEEAGVETYFETPFEKLISLKIGMPLGNSEYTEYELSIGDFLDANDIARRTLNFGKHLEDYWGTPNQKIKDSIGNVCKKIEEREDEEFSFKDVFSFFKEEGFRTTLKNVSEISLFVKGEADNYENIIKFQDANDLAAKIIELGNNFSRDEYYNKYERDDNGENMEACGEMFGMGVGEVNEHLKDLADKVGNIFDDVCRKLEERTMVAESNYQKKEEKTMETKSIDEGAQKKHNSLYDVKAVQNKTENKPMETTEKQDRRTVADLDLEYQSKASKVADLDLEYPYKNRLSEKSFSGKFVPDNNARLIKEAIESNTAPFLPDERGEISAHPIVNANTGFCLNLKDLLPLQVKQEATIVINKDGQPVFDNTYYSPIVATKKSIDAAHTSIKPGERGVFFNFKRADGTIGTSQYFFPEQTEHPEKVIQNAIEKMRASHEGRGNENGIITQKTIKITSSEPKEYLAKYQAAMRTNSFLECSPEISKEFVKKFSVVLNNQLAEKKDFKPEIGTLNKLLFDADKMSYTIAKQMEKNEKAPSQQKHLERNKKSEMSR